jgi:hypothetical protein
MDVGCSPASGQGGMKPRQEGGGGREGGREVGMSEKGGTEGEIGCGSQSHRHRKNHVFFVSKNMGVV